MGTAGVSSVSISSCLRGSSEVEVELAEPEGGPSPPAVGLELGVGAEAESAVGVVDFTGVDLVEEVEEDV